MENMEIGPKLELESSEHSCKMSHWSSGIGVETDAIQFGIGVLGGSYILFTTPVCE